MKLVLEKDRLCLPATLGRGRRVPLAEIESAAVLANHRKASLRLQLLTGEETTISGLDPLLAREIAEKITAAVDPPEARAEEGCPFPEIARRLEVLSCRPGLRASKLMGFLFHQAIMHRASDLHLEGRPDGTRIAFRIDGVLHELGRIAPEPAERLLTYLKVESGVTSYRTDVPQEGALRRENGTGGPVDCRLSFMPTADTESAVLRIFEPSRAGLDLPDLGFAPAGTEGLARLLGRRDGMILLTGPSASGKTTTLYTALRHFGRDGAPRRRVVAIEDPIECRLPGITQVQVDARREMTFSRLLGNLLRQDAEVIMVGEIRDRETAGIAVQASLTGHLILSTIHAGRAPEVMVRLLDLGLLPYQVASALAGAWSQRLLRRVCPVCSQPDEPPAELLREFEKWLPPKPVLRRGAVCDQCYRTGYYGRLPIAEWIETDLSWQELIRSRPSSSEALEFALAKGMVPLGQDAVNQAGRGLTTLEEIKRVLG